MTRAFGVDGRAVDVSDRGLTQNVIPDSGVSRWEYEDDSDTTTALDSWGDNDGSISNASYTTTAQVGSRALSFNPANNHYVEVPHNPTLSQTEAFALSAWVRFDDLSGNRQVIYKGDASSGYAGPWFVRYDSGAGTIRGRIGNGSSHSGLDATINISTNTWYHVIFTGEDTGSNNWDLELFIDGSSDNTASVSQTVSDAGNPLRHGAERSGSSRNMSGIIDDPRIYSKRHSDSEASNLYSSGSI